MGGCPLSPLPFDPDLKPGICGGHACSCENQHEFHLTDDERKKILETWTLLSAPPSPPPPPQTSSSSSTTSSGLQETGVLFFLRFFQLAPDAKEAFPFRDLDDPELLRRNIVFRSHAMRFMRAVEAVTANLDLLDLTVIPNLLSLGRRHTSIHGFQAKYLRVFEEAMTDVWSEILGQKFNKTARTAWKKIFHLIADTLLQGSQLNHR